MATTQTMVPRRGKLEHVNRRLAALACALTVLVLLAGNVAAVDLYGDDSSRLRPAEPISHPWIESQGLRFKLATTAGYDALVRG